ncbi:MAG: peptidylprolyl isomerase [Candidatus Limnocylindrales bacterium]
MTFRAKPVVKRSPKSSWESRDRRNFYLNIGFGLVVVAAVLILLAAIGVSYYSDNLAAVGTVNGQSISKAELRERALIEVWRLDEAQRRVRTQTVAGRLTQAQADIQNQIIEQQRGQIVAIALERLIDNRIQADLATQEGIAITDADIDARVTVEATTRESRHAWLIESAPKTDDGAIEPTAAQIAEAKAKADAALRDLESGKAWDEVAKTVSTDTSTAPQGGDLGWLNDDDSQADEAFLTAIFDAAVNDPTTVIEGEDGIFRIGRVTEIAPESVDEAYTDKIVNDDVDLVQYRTVVRGDVIRQRLEDKIVADAIKPGPQRQVAEIYLAESDPDAPPTAVKVRHILYSPKDDPGAASQGEIPDADPSWAQAKTDADAAYAKLQADPALFDALARSESDEQSANGVTGTGGKLPGYVTADSGYVDSFKTPVLVAGLKDGQILAPVKTEFGYHIVQIMYHPTDVDHLKALKTKADGGADFAALARDNSESETAGRGGDLGWIARGQLGEQQSAGIFGAALGKTSDVIIIKDDGAYLFKVIAEEQRTPEGRQLEQIRSTAFADWYALKKASVVITRDETITDAVG